MTGFKFVLVHRNGREETLPETDVQRALRVVLEADGVPVHGLRGGSVTIVGGPLALAVVRALGEMPRYRGCRIDAIEQPKE
jgi:hypothetical protein